jgi:arylsulfatase A-like enzyme
MDPLEGGIRVPGAIRWPKIIKANTIVDTPTSLLDFHPTINDIIANGSVGISNLVR